MLSASILKSTLNFRLGYLIYILIIFTSDETGMRNSTFVCVPRISRKMGLRLVEQGFSSVLAKLLPFFAPLWKIGKKWKNSLTQLSFNLSSTHFWHWFLIAKARFQRLSPPLFPCSYIYIFQLYVYTYQFQNCNRHWILNWFPFVVLDLLKSFQNRNVFFFYSESTILVLEWDENAAVCLYIYLLVINLIILIYN